MVLKIDPGSAFHCFYIIFDFDLLLLSKSKLLGFSLLFSCNQTSIDVSYSAQRTNTVRFLVGVRFRICLSHFSQDYGKLPLLVEELKHPFLSQTIRNKK